jgi:hypothetical protein
MKIGTVDSLIYNASMTNNPVRLASCLVAIVPLVLLRFARYGRCVLMLREVHLNIVHQHVRKG